MARVVFLDLVRCERLEIMSNKWKFEPDPFTRGYINYLDKRMDNICGRK